MPSTLAGPLPRSLGVPALQDTVARLTDRYEAGRTQSWQGVDAPDAVGRDQLRAVADLPMPIDRGAGKWRMNPN